MTNEEILNIKFKSEDLEKKVTIKEFLKTLLITLFKEQDQFSGKRPFGNSSWTHDLYKAMIKNKLITGSIDEDEYIDDIDFKEAEKFMIGLIKSL